MTSLASALAAAFDVAAETIRIAPQGGSTFGRTFKASIGGAVAFVKTSAVRNLPMYEAEAEGLAALRNADALRVPDVLAVGAAGDACFLALEWLELTPPAPATERELGTRLARQHRVTAAQFGWHRDNTIGATAQANAWSADWVAFWRDRRLAPQLDLAMRRGAPARFLDRGRRLLEHLAAWFTGGRPVPSLLHGDLWGGNVRADASGQPVVYDPAVYFGDRETDLAMTRLFGGFGRAFYEAYEAAWPCDPGAGERIELYNLYHVLNHYNLFGGGYLSQAARMIDRLLADAGC